MEQTPEERDAPIVHRGVIITTPKGPLRVGWKGAQREGRTGREVWYVEFPDGTFSGNFSSREAAYHWRTSKPTDHEGVEE